MAKRVDQEGKQPQRKGAPSEVRLLAFLFSRWGWRLGTLLVLALVALSRWGPPSVAQPLGAAQESIARILGFGLIPVALWALLFLSTLRYRPRWLLQRWREWLTSALLVALTLSLLSFFHPGSGILREVSLAGNWGSYLGGTPVGLGALKALALLFLAFLVFTPRQTLRVSRQGLRLLWQGLRRAGPPTGRLVSRWSRSALSTALRRSGGQGTSQNGTVSSPAEGNRGNTPPQASQPLEQHTPPLSGDGAPAERASPTTPRIPEPASSTPIHRDHQGWQLPSSESLQAPDPSQSPKVDVREVARHIEKCLAEHGVEVSVEQIKPGPRVTQFGVAPGWIRRQRGARGAPAPSLEQLARVRVDNILAREKDLALALKAPSLRMEAPVPGEALVGVEVPNPDPLLVALRAVVEDRRFQEIWLKGGLPLALGQSTGGQAVAVDLREMPHLLIAGATGSGKSVCINGIISALILTQPPDKLRLLLIDPKRVELTPFNGIPHLIAPVILDSDLVVTALKGMLREMQRRYNLFERLRVRNIEAYKRHPQGTDPMPYLVLIIDELADLMMASSYEVEHSLVRLSQLGRATGIHLVIATQRPSVNVVTGLLKANISSRISFAVASQVDSRVILDGAGAEKLLGRGDMLFLSPDAVRPRRLQGTFVSDGEVEGLADFWKSQHGPPLPVIPVLEEAPEPVLEEESTESDDELLEEARSLAQRYSHVSPSLLQRRLRIGYPRAARLLDLLEEEGFVGPGEPGKSRPVQKLR